MNKYILYAILILTGLLGTYALIPLFKNLLIDSNPFLLNNDSYEIDEFILKKKNDGLTISDISDLIDSNPYIINEI